MKKIISAFLSFLMVFSLAKEVKALTDTVSISDLEEYTRSDNFYVSYSALSNDPVQAQFYWMKEGGSYSTLGSPIDGYSGKIQVTGAQVNEQTKYYFKVEINGGTASDETSIIYDSSGPSPVQNYWKERITPQAYKLHWKNPGDSDFSRVLIYRSDSTDFYASDSTKIAEVGGAADAEMTYDNFGLEADKTYYYALRAVDKAGNPSSIVADPEVGVTTVVTTETTSESQTSGGTGSETTIVTPENATGSVLGEEKEGGLDTEEIQKMLQESSEEGGLSKFLSSKAMKGTILTLAGLVVLYYLYRLFFRK